MAKADLTLDYENRAFIPGGNDYPDRWAEAAHDWREVEHAIGRARLNQPYGTGERQSFDLFYPSGRPEGLLVFIHGGYWRMFDRKDWSHFSAGATARGWAVAMPSYTLVPAARISAITQEVAATVTQAASMVAGPVVLTGHSAGGHLVARMNCADVALDAALAARIARIVPISPLSDLRPLMQTDMNADLHLDKAEAAAESPALHHNRRGIETPVWVGSDERPAFLDQARWLADAWDEARLHIAPGCHHFNVIDGLGQPDSALIEALLGPPGGR